MSYSHGDRIKAAWLQALTLNSSWIDARRVVLACLSALVVALLLSWPWSTKRGRLGLRLPLRSARHTRSSEGSETTTGLDDDDDDDDAYTSEDDESLGEDGPYADAGNLGEHPSSSSSARAPLPHGQQRNSRILITSSDPSSNLSVHPVRIDLVPARTARPHLRSASPPLFHHRTAACAGASKKRRKTSKLAGRSDVGSEPSEEEHGSAGENGVAAALSRSQSPPPATSARQVPSPPLGSGRFPRTRTRGSLANGSAGNARLRAKRKVGVAAGEMPAPIPERNSSYHRMFGPIEADPVLVGTSAKDAPPSILRKATQQFRSSPSPSPSPEPMQPSSQPAWTSAGLAHLEPPTSSHAPFRSRAIKLTEPDWDPYAPTHERARQRIEVRQLAATSGRSPSPAVAVAGAGGPAIDETTPHHDELLGSWLTYAAIHSPDDGHEGGNRHGNDAAAATATETEIPWMPAAEGEENTAEFWFERFTSSTAAAGRDWDWRKRRARERREAGEAAQGGRMSGPELLALAMAGSS
ncbi:unnamed protein product [Parajaminaea phylloscopi]